jgi:hypothetical protein
VTAVTHQAISFFSLFHQACCKIWAKWMGQNRFAVVPLPSAAKR